MSTDLRSALLTDHYEFTMLDAALRAGTALRECVFEVFGRRLPPDRGYLVNAGTGRLLELVDSFTFGSDELAYLAGIGLSEATLEWLSDYRFRGDIEGYPEGELFFPGSPLLTVRADFASGVILETLILSVLNHDVAVASAASRMWVQAEGRPLIEMGSRRTHEQAAIAAARATWIAGFATTSNVAAGQRYGIPTAGTAAHAFTLLHDSERDAFQAQVDALGTGTTLLVDTYDTLEGVRQALAVAGPQLGAIRLDSGDLPELAWESRRVLDEAGAHGTRIVATSDLDEYLIAELRAAPVDAFGVGTSVVTGSGSPAAGLVYKLVEVDGRSVAEASAGGKASQGGAKVAFRRVGPDGVAVAEVLHVAGDDLDGDPASTDRLLTTPLVRAGQRIDTSTLDDARARHAASVAELPEAGRALRARPGPRSHSCASERGPGGPTRTPAGVRTSAGLLVYHVSATAGREVFLGHMGGPFWAQRDAGAWSIPKGEYDPDMEPALTAARREFAEEIGVPAPAGDPVDLGVHVQRSGKRVHAFAVPDHPDEVLFVASNTFGLEWPRGSGKIVEFPEIDRAAWFPLADARTRVVSGQVSILDALETHLRLR